MFLQESGYVLNQIRNPEYFRYIQCFLSAKYSPIERARASYFRSSSLFREGCFLILELGLQLKVDNYVVQYVMYGNSQIKPLFILTGTVLLKIFGSW